MKRIFCPLIVLFVWMLSSCIEEYTIPKSELKDSKQVVIQGRILAGEESVFYVSYTKAFGDKSLLQETILNATVTIIGQNGYESPKAEFDIENDYYYIDTKQLEANTLYAVKVEAEGETYQSEFLPLLETPDIKDITYQEREDGNGISIHVSTEGTSDTSSNYMWTFEEDWEFTAPVDFVNHFKGGTVIYNNAFYPLKESTKNEYYRCWKHSQSSNIYIYSTNELQENSVKDFELFRIPGNDPRISCIYSLLLKQTSISDEAYQYYQQIKRFSEESGGLFTPMPYEVKGNITCTSNPTIKARGYILSARVKSKRIFIYASDFTVRENPDHYILCEDKPLSQIDPRAWSELKAAISNGAIVYSPEALSYSYYYLAQLDDTDIYYSRSCVDCRTVEGSTNKRPDFWPVINE